MPTTTHETTTTNPTQVRRPWRSTLRTTLTAAIALVPILPAMVDAARIDEVPAVASVLAATAAISRVLALKPVEEWLQKFMPSLAADVYEGRHRKEHQDD